MEDVRYWQYQWKKEHQEKKLEALRKARKEDLDTLSRSHDDRTEISSIETVVENIESPKIESPKTESPEKKT